MGIKKYHIEMKAGYSIDSELTPSLFIENILVDNYDCINKVVLIPVLEGILDSMKDINSIGVWKLKTLKNEKTK